MKQKEKERWLQAYCQHWAIKHHSHSARPSFFHFPQNTHAHTHTLTECKMWTPPCSAAQPENKTFSNVQWWWNKVSIDCRTCSEQQAESRTTLRKTWLVMVTEGRHVCFQVFKTRLFRFHWQMFIFVCSHVKVSYTKVHGDKELWDKGPAGPLLPRPVSLSFQKKLKKYFIDFESKHH